MRLGSRSITALVLGSAVLSASLHAQALAALARAALAAEPGVTPPAPAAPRPDDRRAGGRSAGSLFERAQPAPRAGPAGALSPCTDVAAHVTVTDDDPDASFAALVLDGRHLLRARGGAVGPYRVVHVGPEHVTLERGAERCVAPVFGRRGLPAAAPAAPATSRFTGKIERVSADEVHVDRGALAAALEDPGTFAGVRAFAERGPNGGGLRLGAVPPGSAVSALGLQRGDRVEAVDGVALDDPQVALATYARLRAADVERVRLRIRRGDRTLELTYVIR